jgi:hypothetical protein
MVSGRQRTGNRIASAQRLLPAAVKVPTRRFPIQREIQKLENELSAFNERISELEDDGHRGHALEVLKAMAMDFASRIDELRSLLVASKRR